MNHAAIFRDPSRKCLGFECQALREVESPGGGGCLRVRDDGEVCLRKQARDLEAFAELVDRSPGACNAPAKDCENRPTAVMRSELGLPGFRRTVQFPDVDGPRSPRSFELALVVERE